MVFPKFASFCSLLAFLSSVAAETPSGFTPTIQQTLQLTYDSIQVSPAGKLLPRSDLATPPTIDSPQGADKGIIVMLDIDVPHNGSRIPLLHWLAPDVDLTSSPAKIATTSGARYLQPNPPAGDFPHRYVFILFAQPAAHFSFPTQFSNIDPPTTSTDRLGFSLAAFAAQAGLGMPLAATYIRVQNSNGTATMPSLPPIRSGTGTANGTVRMSPPSATSTRSKAGAGTPVSVAGGILAGLAVALL